MSQPDRKAPSGSRLRPALAALFADYGILLALVLLCVYYSFATYQDQHPNGAPGGAQLASEIRNRFPPGASVLVVTRGIRDDLEFAGALRKELEGAGYRIAGAVNGDPSDARRELERLSRANERLDVIACNQVTGTWTIFDNLGQKFPTLAAAQKLVPKSFRGSNFLKPENLLNIANQIAVIAVIAIGMTMVILTGGIDLSVGSLIALSAVVAAQLIRRAGAEQASIAAMFGASASAIALCGGIGLLSGVLITFFRLPAFIVTLGTMLVGSGLAFLFARGQSIYQVPPSFVWLGRGADLGVPNAVVLMVLLYGLAHILLTHTRVGRYIYAVGSNAHSARLSGVPVAAILLLVYTVSGALSGLGGIVMASQLKSGAPTYGQMYELYVIAAVVVGGASLSGGEGKVFGTLIGALIIAVIQNGMNLTEVESYTQKVVLGLVILGAVLLDVVKRRGLQWLRPRSQ